MTSHSPSLAEMLRTMRETGSANGPVEGKPAPSPKRGDAIFEHTGGPRTWAEYVGQSKAKGQLRAAVMSAKHRSVSLPHILIASGLPGVGKSALARLVAAEAGVGLTEVQGKLNQDEAKGILSNMQDGDILFLDEIHQLVQGGKYNSEWLLSLMQDGVLLSAQGEWKAPAVSIVGATTNAEELPEPVLTRFAVQPVIKEYSTEEATSIALAMAQTVYEGLDISPPTEETCAAIAAAANNMPRKMHSLIASLLDSEIAELSVRDASGASDLSTILDWAGLTPDGLGHVEQRLMATLLVRFGGRAGKDALAAALGEQVFPFMSEKILMQKGYMSLDRGGRYLTDAGVQRTMTLDLED